MFHKNHDNTHNNYKDLFQDTDIKLFSHSLSMEKVEENKIQKYLEFN